MNKSSDSLNNRYLELFRQIDTTKNFYFSYYYNLATSFQSGLFDGSSDRFVWNSFLNEPLAKYSEWKVNVIHGFVDQASNCLLM